MSADLKLRMADPSDHSALNHLITDEYYVHKHLDWRPPLEWLGYQPFFVLESNHRIQAALACPPEPPEVAWIRLFACSSTIDLELAWQSLLDACSHPLPDSHHSTMAILSLHEWVSILAQESGFLHYQDIIVFEWQGTLPSQLPLAPGVVLRQMEHGDIPAVAAVDRLAFEPLWQISLDALNRSFHHASYATVAELDGEIIGYQISTHTYQSAHLARLAVRPNLQRRYIGYSLVEDLQRKYKQRGIWHITVNTQSNNLASQSLYQKMSFRKNGDVFPVYILRNPLV
jgi:ribosomal protein S18 acetylase RimI-like enzyme